jgi:hypothetical protein
LQCIFGPSTYVAVCLKKLPSRLFDDQDSHLAAQ